MNTLTLLGVLLCIVMATGRHFEDRKEHARLTDLEDQNEDFTKQREHAEPRHRRRRWQMGYGYDYPPPQHGYYPERRDYDRNQQELSKIINLLEEISAYVRRPNPPPPPPQPIYIPYPVPYPIPQYSPCFNKGTKKPNVTSRFPDMEDSNQNWGFVIPKEDEADEDYDYSRPISFEPVKPIQPMKRPSPKVEHGSSQAEVQASTAAPVFADDATAPKASSMCTAAILACCSDKNQRLCFTNFGCTASYDRDNVCRPESISKALDTIKKAYAPAK